MVYTTAYYPYDSNLAGQTTDGGVPGFVQDRYVQDGLSGASILLEQLKYRCRTSGGSTDAVLSYDEVYRNADGTGAETTTYVPTWSSLDGVTQPLSVTAALPVVSPSENGSGSADATTVVYDAYGRAVWTKDAAGYITYAAYDDATGAVIETIDDVNMTGNTSDSQFQSAKTLLNGLTGWTTPAGGGLNLVTTYEVDSLGRTWQTVDPNGNITTIDYQDATASNASFEVHVHTALNETVYRTDLFGNYTETRVNNGSGAIQSLTRTLMNDAGQVVAELDYFDLTGVTYSTLTARLGSPGANYLETDDTYGTWGDLVKVVDPTGTIYELTYDALGRVAREEQGLSAGSMQTTAVYVYDNNLVGDSNLTESRAYFGSGANDYYPTYYQYDYRDRLVGTLGPDGMATVVTLDNLDEATLSQTYANASYDNGTKNGQITCTSGNLRGQAAASYDDQGRVYESDVYAVDPANGSVGDHLATKTWYDPRGYVAKTVTGSGAFQKNAYDGAGRLTAAYISYDNSENATDYTAAMTVTGDTVVEQTNYWYDADGQTIATATYERLPDDTLSTGALTAANSYVTVAKAWYDALGRVTYDVDYGREDVLGGTATDFFNSSSGSLRDANSNGVADLLEGTPPEPNSSDNYVVTKYVYDPRVDTTAAIGEIIDTIDNADRTSETQYDLAGRVVRTIENYANGTVEAGDTQCDVTTKYDYDTLGRLATVTAFDARGTGETIQEEATKYLYNSPYDASLTTAVVSPDSTDVLNQDTTTHVWTITTDNGDHTTTAYDLLGRATDVTDQRGVVHHYDYDSAGRLSADTVTDLGRTAELVNGAVRRIGYTFDDCGRVKTVTSYNTATPSDPVNPNQVVNQIAYKYDSWGNLEQEWQETDGLVDNDGQGTDSPSVQYGYSDGATDGVAKYVRLTDLVYPNGRSVHYDYGTTNGTDDVLSRVETISDNVLASTAYRYLGAGTIVTEDYQQPDVKLDYSASNFSALDRFGRVHDQIWSKYGSGGGTRDSYEYAYNPSGTVQSRVNALDDALSEFYGYDDLDRLTSMKRGSVSNPDYQSWGLDGVGNWLTSTTGSTTDTKTFDPANQTATTTASIPPTYDAAGNMTLTPKPGNPAAGWTCVYDAWNRLVSASDGTTTVTYQYDGTGRLTVRSDGTTTERYSYSGQQLVQVYKYNSVGEFQGG